MGGHREEGRQQGQPAPQLLYGEPDLTLKVVRDLFTEDFAKLVIEGDDAWETVAVVRRRTSRPTSRTGWSATSGTKGQDVFAAYRIDEQIEKGLERKVWLPSGGSLVIDRTEAMTVVDVNTGKFTGSGGNLEETVTKNNLEAAEEIVRQLRLRDIGGIIVVDFIDMVLESNRDLVLRRLVECLGRDRTRHQVAEVTSLGLVQMTRKRIGTGLLESFSHDCTVCHGRGVVIEDEPVEPKQAEEDDRRGRRGRSRGKSERSEPAARTSAPSPKDIAAMARHEPRRRGRRGTTATPMTPRRGEGTETTARPVPRPPSRGRQSDAEAETPRPTRVAEDATVDVPTRPTADDAGRRAGRRQRRATPRPSRSRRAVVTRTGAAPPAARRHAALRRGSGAPGRRTEAESPTSPATRPTPSTCRSSARAAPASADAQGRR